MRTCIVLACLAAAACGDSDSDAYTIGQVAHGYGYGVVTGIDYGYGRVSGYGAIGNRGYLGYAGHLGYGYGGHLGHHYGKRSADSDSKAYTFGQIAHGLPVHNAYATGHPYNVGVVTGVDYGYGHLSGYGAIGNRGYAGYGGHGGYGGYGHYLGKRSADSDSKAYKIGQIAYGLPIHNAYATGHPHNVGVITGVSHGYGYAGYGGLGYAGHGYAGLGYSYGK